MPILQDVLGEITPRNKINLCYEIHGRANENFNLVSDECVSVNAHYAKGFGRQNIINTIGVRARTLGEICFNIRVEVMGCRVAVSNSSNELLRNLDTHIYEVDDISIRQYSDRVRITVPNCDQLALIMWVVCEQGDGINIPDMIRFKITRGLNLKPTSHGLLGKQ